MSTLILSDELIEQRFNEITDRDGYGQRMIFDQRITSMLPEFTQEQVKRFCSTSKKWNCSLYGGKVGQFHAITKKF